ncbi:hypothetical protein MnTg02_01361 [bacterium MnTg02]|nr:hypothetical protein MnTg02_01361 [bacterium MnTg02]
MATLPDNTSQTTTSDKDKSGSTPKKPNPIDVHVGSRVKLRRMLVGMSQEKLGDKMSLTFQQIQKYEKGANRIGASRLYQLAKILDVPVQFFFEEAARLDPDQGQPGFAEDGGENFLVEFVNSREGLELNKSFVRIADPKIRRRVIDLVRSLSGQEQKKS